MFGKPLATPATTSSAFTAFGANTSTFGAAKPFGQVSATPNAGLFGQSQPSAFGAQTTNTFGAAPAFGQQPAQNTSLFGSNPTSAAPTFGLGAAPAASTGFGFGQTNTNTNTGLFGAQKPTFNTGATPFGTTQPSSSTTGFTGFGQPGGTSLFNQPKPNTGFGAFGQPQAQAQPAVSFGQPTGGLFGSTMQPTGGLFGNSNANSGGGLFGNTNTGFGAGNTSLGFGGSQQPNPFGGQQQAQMQQAGPEIHQRMLSLTSNPYGDNELFKGLKPLGLSEDSLRVTNPAAQKALLEATSNFKVSPNATSKIRVKPISAVVTKKSLFDGLEEYDASLDESFSLKINPKRLIIKPRTSLNTSKPLDASITLNKTRDDPKIFEKENDAPEIFQNQISMLPPPDEQDTDRRVSWLRTAPSQGIRSRPKIRESGGDSTFTQLYTGVNKEQEVLQEPDQDTSLSHSISMIDETFHSNDDANSELDMSVYSGSAEPHPSGIILRRAGYYTLPTLDEIKEYRNSEGRYIVPNFAVGRRGYGNVYYDEEIDVTGLNLDEIVHFRNKEINLYHNEDNKPPVGQELNRKAQVTLDQIWPYDKTTHEPIKDPERLEIMGYEAKMRRICEKRQTKFIEYRPETGSCVFKVNHFSKYTLTDSDDEDGDNEPRTDPKKAKLVGNLVSKKLENGKEVNSITAQSEGMKRMRQQESTFYLGQHAGQRSFQPCELISFP